MSELICCEIGCGKPAEFEIFDKMNKDPYHSVHSCKGHVGELLMHMDYVEVEEGVAEEWTVVKLYGE